MSGKVYASLKLYSLEKVAIEYNTIMRALINEAINKNASANCMLLRLLEPPWLYALLALVY